MKEGGRDGGVRRERERKKRWKGERGRERERGRRGREGARERALTERYL